MTYEITDTQEVQDLTRAGTPRTVFRVWIVTENGATGQVDVKPSDWETEKLKVILAEKATQLDLAFNLNS